MRNIPLEAAIFSDRLGLGRGVFPLSPGSKLPAVEGWQDFAATTGTDFCRTLENFPTDRQYNYGVACGGHLVVIDVDTKGGGLETMRGLDLPQTMTVRTPSGGFHFYYSCNEDFANSARRLGPGIDTRGLGGYVVGPGSELDGGRRYEIQTDAPVAPLPGSIADRLKAARERPLDAPRAVGGDDTPADIAAAAAWLAAGAPLSIEFQGGNNTGYLVAARVLDFVSSPDTAFEILAECWNPRCQPPWSDAELRTLVRNAMNSRQDPAGREKIRLALEAIEGAPNVPHLRSKFFRTLLTEAEETQLEPVPWLVEGVLAREVVTVLAAPGGSGKSLLTMQIAAALVTGDGERFGFPVIGGPKRVVVINNEDPKREMQKRFAAIAAHFGTDRQAIHDNLFCVSGADAKIRLVERDRTGRAVDLQALTDLREIIAEDRIDAIIFDPLVTLSGLDENANREMQELMDRLTGLAASHKCAVLVVHHTTKPPQGSSDGHAGNVNSIRGASAIKDAARVALTFFAMSEKDRAAYSGIDARERHRYVRLDDAKGNLHLLSPDPVWFKKVTVTLPNGERTGALEPVTLRKASEASRDADIATRGNIVRGLAAILEKSTSVAVAARALAGLPEFATTRETTLRTAIVEALSGGPAELVNGRSLSLVKDGKSSGEIIVQKSSR